LHDAEIKLSSVAPEVLGMSARRMLDALIPGTHDLEVLANPGSCLTPTNRSHARGHFRFSNPLLACG
jgi:hypothetical protein